MSGADIYAGKLVDESNNDDSTAIVVVSVTTTYQSQQYHDRFPNRNLEKRLQMTILRAKVITAGVLSHARYGNGVACTGPDASGQLGKHCDRCGWKNGDAKRVHERS